MENNFSNYILVLPSWYPNKTSLFNGDFIQRHIKATSLFCKIIVLHIVKDEKGDITKNYLLETKASENITEYIVYYKSLNTNIGLIDKIISHIKYMYLYKKFVKKTFSLNGLPKLCHVHIAMKAGIVAIWIKKKWGIRYVLSEQSTIYLSNSDYQLKNTNSFFKTQTKNILKNASAITTVSNYLGKAIQKYYSFVKFNVVPNVVDNTIFFPANKTKIETTTFIHISNFFYQKNIDAILNACFLLKKSTDSFVLNLFGKATDTIKQKIVDLNLTNQVFIKGEASQEALAKAINNSDALILYSKYETFGCVIIEANACNIPVIVSNIEVFNELIINNKNGLIVEADDASKLTNAMNKFIIKDFVFDENENNKLLNKYTFKNVGNIFFEIYKSVLNNA